MRTYIMLSKLIYSTKLSSPSIRLVVCFMVLVLCSLVAACMRLGAIASGPSIAMLVAVVVAV